jgi:methylenetetrahydrofolate dehydrogenase (NADP+)/methenyltetrahydrofolate cyclohydrolase
MAAKILDGRKLSQKILDEVKKEVKDLKKQGITPCLACIQVGEDPASRIYVKKKKEACSQVGIIFRLFSFSENVTTEDILQKIRELNSDRSTHGIIVQLPLPKHINKQKIIEFISPQKDVDGFHPQNWGKLAYSSKGFVPATAAGIIRLLKEYNISLSGKNIVIIGKSNIVGKPTALLCLQKEATVTICHKKTRNLKNHTKQADILISATGAPKLIKKDMVAKDAVVIDVGISRVGDKIVGDVDFKNVKDIASFITPIPGGVGPMTVIMLLKNVIKAASSFAS